MADHGMLESRLTNKNRRVSDRSPPYIHLSLLESFSISELHELEVVERALIKSLMESYYFHNVEFIESFQTSNFVDQ